MVKVEYGLGSCAYLTEETYAQIHAEEEEERREREWFAKAWDWLNDPANKDSEIYSDVYKDVYGVRPRW